MKIAIGNDHVGVELKRHIMEHLQAQGHEVVKTVPLPCPYGAPEKIAATSFAPTQTVVCANAKGRLRLRKRLQSAYFCIGLQDFRTIR